MPYKRIPWGKNHCCRQPSRLIFVDTETSCVGFGENNVHERHYLRCGVAKLFVKGKDGFTEKSKIRFITPYDFWEWCYAQLRSRKPTWCYGHNIAFDFTVLGGWSEIDVGRLRTTETQIGYRNVNGERQQTQNLWRGKMALDGIPFILETRSDFGPIKFIDTYNYWNVPLEKLGRWVGLDKIDQDPFGPILEDIYLYCERDVDIIAQSVIRLLNYWKENDCGNWQPTIASLAYSAYRHGKENCSIVAHGDERHEDELQSFATITDSSRPLSAGEVSDVERRSYFGGRTECFFVGEIRRGAIEGQGGMPNLYRGRRPQICGPVTVLDVNSMYAHIMASETHPIELLDTIRYPQMSEAERLIEEFWCCADVEIRTNESVYPKRHGEYIIYPIGSYGTSLCGSELLSAVKAGYIAGIANLCIYYSGRPFANFVGTWHGRRTEAILRGRDIEQRFCNQMMQSLYGKLAQQTPLWQTCGTEIPPIRWGGYIGQPGIGEKPCLMRAIGGVSQYQATRRNCRHTFTAAAGSVTSAARSYIRKLIGTCPLNSIVYTDTDSLFCLPSATAVLRDAQLVHETELGKLKEKGTYNEVIIHGQKDYELDGIRTIAGLRSDAVEISERLWNQINFEGVKSIIQHEPTNDIIGRTVRFDPSSTLMGRAVQYDGWTKPLVME